MTQHPNPDSEDALELEAIAILEDLGWESANCFSEICGEQNPIGRETRQDVILEPRLLKALRQLNPTFPDEALSQAIEELKRDRSTTIENANRDIYQLLKDGIQVTYKDDNGDDQTDKVKVIDWSCPEANDRFVASQMWILGEAEVQRTDLICFINGLPLVVIELKRSEVRIEEAYKDNIKRYKEKIPQLFWYNAFILLSNGKNNRIGSLTAPLEHYSTWKKINAEGEEGIIALEILLLGTCNPNQLIDILENFTFFYTEEGKLRKIVAKNHQYLGVNNAVQAVREIDTNQGKLGVFWHTQGSGKSYSMVFMAQKILRKLTGNWTFLVITDRTDLDDQIYKNFAKTGAVTEKQQNVRAKNAEHLQTMLNQEDHRYIFTLIQKFRSPNNKDPYPKLSDRSDIIVITDEAHRSQYDTFRLNLKNALPNAAFIGFTGTPLISDIAEKTKEEFGDYVSIYDFKESIDDQATVPLFYENRIPELQLDNSELNEDVYSIIDSAHLDEAQEDKLEREFSRQYYLIADRDRLNAIAEDIVTHFMGRGFRGKAMVISIDRFSAVQMYEYVQNYWKQRIATLKAKLTSADQVSQKRLSAQITYMEETDMAAVISFSKNDTERFADKGLILQPHRDRLADKKKKELLEEQFKDPDHPLRIAFVCSMWITGFDAPSCSTVYLDRPMKDHTLMQTVARANRVYADKANGVIVDYIGVFRNLQKALSIYGSADGNDSGLPVAPKSEQVAELRGAIAEIQAFCQKLGIDLQALAQTIEVKERIAIWSEAVNKILVNDQTKLTYFTLVGRMLRLHKAILPDQSANEFIQVTRLFRKLNKEIRGELPDVDINAVKPEIEALLDESISAGEFYIPDTQGQYIDLSKIDFDELKTQFEQGFKNTRAEKLKGSIQQKLQKMVAANKTRLNYYDKYQRMIEDYNSGSRNITTFFDDLISFAQELETEDQRAIAENLTEEELTIFDLLTKPDINLSKSEEKEVKAIARELLEKLKAEKLILDWRKRQQARAAVRLTVEDVLDALPATFTDEAYENKCNVIYEHIFDAYQSKDQSIFNSVA